MTLSVFGETTGFQVLKTNFSYKINSLYFVNYYKNIYFIT